MAKAPSAPAELVAAKKGKAKTAVVITVAILLAVGLSVTGQQTAAAAPLGTQKAVYELLDPAFVVNFQAEGRQRYMQVSLALMARNENDLNQLKVHMPTLRNQLVMLFSSQHFDDLNTPLGLELLKQKLTTTVQELAMREIGKPVVDQVLFTNFVMQ